MHVNISSVCRGSPGRGIRCPCWAYWRE